MAYSRLYSEETDVRILLIGKTGTGKSAAGNTIMRKNAFESRPAFSSVTLECEKETDTVCSKTVTVIDTPGLFDTRKSLRDVAAEIAVCISFAAPGPHVFLIVIQLGRFTGEERKSVEIIQTMFGEGAQDYTMVLFTHGDILRSSTVTIDKLIGQNEHVANLIKECRGGYHVFDNTDNDLSQVSELLRKIDAMVQRNGGSYYTKKMFKEAQTAKTEEMERLLTENPQMEVEEARRRAERKNSFIRAVVAGIAAGAGAGAGVGAAFGAIAGPVGVGVGAAVGAPLGAAVAAVVAVKEKACIIQ